MKKVYPQKLQQEVLERVESILLEELTHVKGITKVVLFGSLVRGTFGEYDELRNDAFGSDIDVLIMANDEFTPPASWIKIWSGKTCDSYTFSFYLEQKLNSVKFNPEKPKHHFSLIVFDINRHDIARAKEIGFPIDDSIQVQKVIFSKAPEKTD